MRKWINKSMRERINILLADIYRRWGEPNRGFKERKRAVRRFQKNSVIKKTP
ncbi:hypothetical protein CFter6_1839 [Collimonas fungivorans]|uniref:Uncharacterized protein n=1 Tax=Collimonas fungivorans TaxID=158899 RepID=A0A127P9Q8_9BURK|nr:hypothetical protein CFter6_1839 [Collimonas fungivorans]